MENLNSSLQDNEEVKALLDLMNETKMTIKVKDYYDLVCSIDAMEQKLNMAVSELQNIKETVEPKEKKNPFIEIASDVSKSLEGNIKEAKSNLQMVKENIVKNAVLVKEDFKQKGVVALDKVVDTIKIKKGLQNIKNSLNKVILIAEKSILKIEMISKEYHEMGYHAKRMIKAFTGQEQNVVVKEKGALAKQLQCSLKNIKNNFTQINKKIDTAIFRIEHLERNAETDRQKIAQRAGVNGRNQNEVKMQKSKAR